MTSRFGQGSGIIWGWGWDKYMCLYCEMIKGVFMWVQAYFYLKKEDASWPILLQLQSLKNNSSIISLSRYSSIQTTSKFIAKYILSISMNTPNKPTCKFCNRFDLQQIDMFASQAPTNRDSFDSKLKSIQSNSNRLQFFSSLFTTNEITYLDPHKVYCIIQTDRYLKIKEELASSLNNQQALEKRAYELNLDNIGLGRELAIYREETQKLNQNHQALIEEYQRLAQRNSENERTIQELRQQPRKNQRQIRVFEEKSNQNQQAKEKSLQTTSSQTVALGELEGIQQPVETKENVQTKPQVEEAEQRLYELMQAEMQKFQQQFQEKISALEQAKHNIEKWQAENKFLRDENAELKQKIIDRDIEEEKLKIWKENIFGFVSRVESEITEPSRKRSNIFSEDNSSQQVQRLKEEVLELRGRVIEMRSKVRRIDEMMESQGDVNDDGAIGLLVRLSQKVKNIVKGMIMEVEQV